MGEGKTNDDRLRARARLALRAERAFGLNALPIVRRRADDAAPIAPIAPPPPVHRADGPLKLPPGAQATPATRPLPAAAVAQVVHQKMVPLPMLPVGPFTAPELSPDEKRSRLIALDENEVRGCPRCRLCETRTHTVFGEGDPNARLFFIGEGPGENEDLTGRPFVGRAGGLLEKQINAMGLKREDVFIANIVKCRPPGNREPAPDEVQTCSPYLERQLEIVRPKVIVTLGRPSTQYMLQSKLAMSRMRGQWHEWRGIKLMPTFHPAYLLRSYTEENRRLVWNDLQQVMHELGLTVPKRADA